MLHFINPLLITLSRPEQKKIIPFFICISLQFELIFTSPLYRIFAEMRNSWPEIVNVSSSSIFEKSEIAQPLAVDAGQNEIVKSLDYEEA